MLPSTLHKQPDVEPALAFCRDDGKWVIAEVVNVPAGSGMVVVPGGGVACTESYRRYKTDAPRKAAVIEADFEKRFRASGITAQELTDSRLTAAVESLVKKAEQLLEEAKELQAKVGCEPLNRELVSEAFDKLLADYRGTCHRVQGIACKARQEWSFRWSTLIQPSRPLRITKAV